jgi:hopanoid biosynthesis associated protein HpnK
VKFLIINADDFGLHPSVNEAVEEAHKKGVLTSASLMVGAVAAEDAIERAKRLPGLRVGLHVVVVDGHASSPPQTIPSIADREGRLGDNLLAFGIKLLRPAARRQLREEIRAQFRAFALTGLSLDHVNVHKHLHVHPLVLTMLIEIAQEFGSPPIRVPHEPGWDLSPDKLLMRPWLKRMTRRCRAAGLYSNDQLFGLADSGRMDESRLLSVLSDLPYGVTEIYSHPAKELGIAKAAPDYLHTTEFEALMSERVRGAVYASGARLGGYRDAFQTAR